MALTKLDNAGNWKGKH